MNNLYFYYQNNYILSTESIFLDEKPTIWSVKNRTSLDDDEANMELIPKAGSFIKFEVKNFGKNIFLENLAKENQQKVYVIGFTTELWTLNSLRALSVNENVQYGIYQFDDALYVMSRSRYKHHRLFFREQKATLLSTQTGLQISQLKVFDYAFEREVPILSNDLYGKNEKFGSGISCICPGHYSRDFQTSEKYNLSKRAHVTKFGRLDQSVPLDLQNLKVIDGEADDHILQKLIDKDLVLDIEENYETETYFDKKTNEKLIVRTQQTVYSKLPDFEREYFLEQLKEKSNIKISGQSIQQNKQDEEQNQEGAFGTLEQQIKDKSDNWTISSNHEWGIPIPIFFYKNTNQQKYLLEPAIVKYIIGLYEQYGSQIWYSKSIEELLPQKYKNLADQLEKGTFVFDLWFESGCSWYVMLKSKSSIQDYRQQFLIKQNEEIKQKQQQLSIENKQQNTENVDQNQLIKVTSEQNQQESKQFNIVQKYPCDLTIQGKDQIDSWLLSTSLLSIGLKEQAFFNNLKLHRVIPAQNDEKLSKLSQFKSNIDDLIEGNIKLNGERQYGYGVDILRLWVALSDKVRDKVIEKKSRKEKDDQAIQLVENSDYIFMRPNEFDQPNNYINVIRKCLWGMLGTLKGYHQNVEQVKYNSNGKLSFLSDFMMTQLVLYMVNMHRAYSSLDYSKNVDLTIDFIKNWVYDFFIDATKNFIIANPLNPKSQEYLFVYSKIVEYLLIGIAPMIPHNAEDIFSNVHFKQNKKHSIFHYDWPDMSKDDVYSLQEKIPKQNFLWELRDCIWQQLTFQMERYQNIRSKERYDVVIVVEDVFSKAYQLIEQTCIDDLDIFIGAGKVKVHTEKENQEYPHRSISTFKYKGLYKNNEKIHYTIKIYLSDYFKCIRCLKYTAVYENTICPHCVTYLSTNHKKECATLLTSLKKYPNAPVKIIDQTKKLIDEKLIQQ